MAGPGIANGRNATSIAEMVNLYPTLVDLVGVAVPPCLSEISMKDGVEDASKTPRTSALTQYENGYSLRTHRYRYTEWGEHGSDGKELYDHLHDPAEMQDLAAREDQNEIISRLAALLKVRVNHAQEAPMGIRQIRFEITRKVPQC